jgi:hypothetical protein
LTGNRVHNEPIAVAPLSQEHQQKHLPQPPHNGGALPSNGSSLGSSSGPALQSNGAGAGPAATLASHALPDTQH